MNYWTQSKNNIFVAAHRGWSTKYPENTMEAFRAALELGVDQVETDVRMTADGELVCIHDATVDRTTNGTGKVEEMTFAELQALDAGSWKGEAFVGCKIPRFVDFMELFKDHPTMTLDVELKVYPTAGKEQVSYDICDRVFAMIDEYGFADRCVINTFSPKLHEYIRAKYGTKFRQHVYYPRRVYADAEGVDSYTYGYCVCMFGGSWGMATKEEFDEMRAKYPQIQTWAPASIKDEAGVDDVIRCGAELITCNNPDEILRILRQKGYHN